MTDAVRTRGIDVSHHNGVISWSAKKRTEGISFGMAKCTQGVDFYDPQYVANREGCHVAGMPFIAYCYAEPGSSSALAQAKNFVAKATKGGTVEGFCLDLEKSTLGQPETNAWMRAFGDNLRALAPDVPTFAYLGGYAANGSGQSAVDHFDHWIYPHYLMNTWPTLYTPRVGGNTTGWTVPPAPALWQCSDNVGGTDADVSNLTLPQLFTGADMPITAADVPIIVNTKCIPSKRIDPATGKPSGELISIAALLASIDVNLVIANPGFADDIAQAVVAALPPSSGGTGPTADQLAAAVVAMLATKLGGATT